jgi:hypothetical protein
LYDKLQLNVMAECELFSIWGFFIWCIILLLSRAKFEHIYHWILFCRLLVWNVSHFAVWKMKNGT